MTDIRRQEQGRLRVLLKCDDPSLARQSEKDAADVNKIVARFEKTGLLPQVDVIGEYLDVSEVGDYREALDRVERANRVFMQMPAKARARFDNDPARFVDEVQWLRPEELVELGLREAPIVVPPVGSSALETPAKV